jgi:hypothetical protein
MTSRSADAFMRLAATATATAARPVPRAWTRDQPDLAAHPDLGHLITAITRSNTATPASSDQTIRALRALAHTDDLAATILIHAVATVMRRRMRYRRNHTPAYLSDAIAHLTLATFEADDIDTATDLAERLANRAIARLNKNYRREKTLREKSRWLAPDTLPDPSHPDRLRSGNFLESEENDRVHDRLSLEQFRDAVHNAIKAGDLTTTTWERWRDVHLAAAAQGAPPGRPPVIRARSLRAATLVRTATADVVSSLQTTS